MSNEVTEKGLGRKKYMRGEGKVKGSNEMNSVRMYFSNTAITATG